MTTAQSISGRWSSLQADCRICGSWLNGERRRPFSSAWSASLLYLPSEDDRLFGFLFLFLAMLVLLVP